MTSAIREPTTRRRIVQGVLAGAAAGVMAGLFGVGGGIVIVPVLVLVLKMPQRLAHGTSLAAILPVAVAGLVGYWTDGEVDWPVAGLLTVGAVVGAVIGTRLLHVVPVRALALGFAAILLASAIELILHTGSEVGRSELTLAAAAGLFLLGLAAGTLAGLLGVGGGVVLVPGMVILFHLLPATAKGTSLAVIIPTALAGTWRNLRERNADVAVATAVGLAGVLTAFAMSKVSVSLDEDVANAMFAVLMILVAVRMVYEQLSRRPAAAH